MQKIITPVIIGFILVTGCAHQSQACLQQALRSEMVCLKSAEINASQQGNNINSNNENVQLSVFGSNSVYGDSVRRCRMLYKVTYKECVVSERMMRR